MSFDGIAGEMSAAQRRELKALAEEAFEPDAFADNLAPAEADRRIRTLRAKLRLLDAPPHTL
jgi:hypothetical protein